MPGLRSVVATRYVTPLREGGSLPGLMEADDLGTYVVKFTGAGQGRKALIAEIVGTSLARTLGLPVTELVTVDVDPVLAANEPDEEVQDLLRASPGRNLGVDFLPGALDLDASAFPVDAQFAGRVLWLDALINNVDRSWRNPNMLFWHRQPYLIDHGASLTFHHAWSAFDADRVATRPYDAGEHALITSHPDLDAADAALTPLITAAALDDVLAAVPDEWLADEPGFDSPAAVRAAYREALLARVAAHYVWLPPLQAMAEQGGARRAGRSQQPPVVAGPLVMLLPFEYAVLRVVPRVDRGETVNAGVVRYCPAADFLGAAVGLDEQRVRALDPGVDLEMVQAALAAVVGSCDGIGRAAAEDRGRRFRWLTAPRSTIVQPGPVHTGLTADPAVELVRLQQRLVAALPE